MEIKKTNEILGVKFPVGTKVTARSVEFNLTEECPKQVVMLFRIMDSLFYSKSRSGIGQVFETNKGQDVLTLQSGNHIIYKDDKGEYHMTETSTPEVNVLLHALITQGSEAVTKAYKDYMLSPNEINGKTLLSVLEKFFSAIFTEEVTINILGDSDLAMLNFSMTKRVKPVTDLPRIYVSNEDINVNILIELQENIINKEKLPKENITLDADLLVNRSEGFARRAKESLTGMTDRDWVALGKTAGGNYIMEFALGADTDVIGIDVDNDKIQVIGAMVDPHKFAMGVLVAEVIKKNPKMEKFLISGHSGKILAETYAHLDKYAYVRRTEFLPVVEDVRNEVTKGIDFALDFSGKFCDAKLAPEFKYIPLENGTIDLHTTPVPQLAYGRDFTKYEKYLIAKNEAQVKGIEIDPLVRATMYQVGSGEVLSYMFIGASGNGKTTQARVIGKEIGAVVVSQNMSANIEEAEIIGMFQPNPDGKGFTWVDGILTKAVRYGWDYIAEEVNFAKPGVLGKFNSLLDKSRQLELPTGEVVPAHENFRFGATMNPNYQGTQKMNLAFMNRFQRVVKFQDMKRAKEIEIIKLETGYKNAGKINKIMDTVKELRDYIKREEIDAVVTIRNIVEWVREARYTGDFVSSAKATVVFPAAYDDDEIQDALFKTVELKLKGLKY